MTSGPDYRAANTRRRHLWRAARTLHALSRECDDATRSVELWLAAETWARAAERCLW